MADGSLNPILTGNQPEPVLVVLSGPSGVGKDSVLLRMKEIGVSFTFVITMNSRPRRSCEEDGVDYHFVTSERFEEMIAQEELLEWARVYGHYRGVPRSDIRQALSKGQDVLLRVNVDGAATIKQIAPEAILIFLAPESLDDLRQRLYQRRQDSPEEIERRLNLARQEIESVSNFDYIVINRENTLDETVEQIRAIIAAEKHRVFPRTIHL
jgi:guanylate kinase